MGRVLAFRFGCVGCSDRGGWGCRVLVLVLALGGDLKSWSIAMLDDDDEEEEENRLAADDDDGGLLALSAALIEEEEEVEEGANRLGPCCLMGQAEEDREEDREESKEEVTSLAFTRRLRPWNRTGPFLAACTGTCCTCVCTGEGADTGKSNPLVIREIGLGLELNGNNGESSSCACACALVCTCTCIWDCTRD